MARIHLHVEPDPAPEPRPWPVTNPHQPQPTPSRPPLHVWYDRLFGQAILPDPYSSYPMTFVSFACSECHATVTDQDFEYTNRNAHTQWHQDQERLINDQQDSDLR